MMFNVLTLLSMVSLLPSLAAFETTALPIITKDPNVMAQQFVKSVLTDVSIPPLSITTDLGYKGTIYADIHNFRTTNVNPGEAASLAKVSPDSIALAAPGMAFDVTADWNVEWRKYFFWMQDAGTIEYHLRAEVMSIEYVVEQDEIPVSYSQQSCQLDIEFSEPTFSGSSYSWFYASVVRDYESDLVVIITDTLCDLLDPAKNDVAAEGLQSSFE
ncbi:uncharacterized protein [Apostichopus japonicus]|uniref:uncharacterized protein n=1 Tax=Stichopus japonicus TaxID=307972 RepID=UPI003AB569EC